MSNQRSRARRTDPLLAVAVMQLIQRIMELPNKPPMTLALMAVNAIVFYCDLLLPPELAASIPSVRDGCLLPFNVIRYGEWSRVIWAAFLHLDEWHLYYNMASLLSKGLQMESQLGSLGLLGLVAELVVVSGTLMTGGLYYLGSTLHDSDLAYTCAAGFSAVLFGLKYVATCREGGTDQLQIGSWSMPMFLNVPTKHIAWAELLLVHFLFPGTSFSGHLCGILAGVLHVHVVTPLLTWSRQTYRAPPRSSRAAQRHAAAHDRQSQEPVSSRVTAAEAAMQAALQRQAQQQARGMGPSRRQL